MAPITHFKNDTDLIPAIIQDYTTKQVLMLGYMNKTALEETIKNKQVTFFSRSKNRLWVKGETSKNFLHYHEHFWDCDQDTILIFASPAGPTCHNGTTTCFNQPNDNLHFLNELKNIIQNKKIQKDPNSYTYKLFQEGVQRIAQKVGEEGLETALEAVAQNKIKLTQEAADLVFHLLVLLEANDLSLNDVILILQKRHDAKK